MSDKPAINTNLRLFDLVRYMRSELHQQDLISDEEYYWLSSQAPMANSLEGGSPSPRRLEDYDELRDKIKFLTNYIQALEKECSSEQLSAAQQKHYYNERDTSNG